MAKKYTFADINTDEKPAIRRCLRHFGRSRFTWKCEGRGSVGFGATPTEAYWHWRNNWVRRLAFYGAREGLAVAPSAKGRVCNRCGVDGLHWAMTGAGWRLFDAAEQLHGCPARYTNWNKTQVKETP